MAKEVVVVGYLLLEVVGWPWFDLYLVIRFRRLVFVIIFDFNL